MITFWIKMMANALEIFVFFWFLLLQIIRVDISLVACVR